MVNPGEMADSREARKALLELANISVLRVGVLRPIKAFQSVKLGQTVDVLPGPPSGERYRAKVKVIDEVFDAASGAYLANFCAGSSALPSVAVLLRLVSSQAATPTVGKSGMEI